MAAPNPPTPGRALIQATFAAFGAIVAVLAMRSETTWTLIHDYFGCWEADCADSPDYLTVELAVTFGGLFLAWSLTAAAVFWLFAIFVQPRHAFWRWRIASLTIATLVIGITSYILVHSPHDTTVNIAQPTAEQVPATQSGREEPPPAVSSPAVTNEPTCVKPPSTDGPISSRAYVVVADGKSPITATPAPAERHGPYLVRGDLVEVANVGREIGSNSDYLCIYYRAASGRETIGWIKRAAVLRLLQEEQDDTLKSLVAEKESLTKTLAHTANNQLGIRVVGTQLEVQVNECDTAFLLPLDATKVATSTTTTSDSNCDRMQLYQLNNALVVASSEGTFAHRINVAYLADATSAQ